MPYTYRKQGDKYVVYKKNGGKRVGSTAGNKTALHKYLTALHMHAMEEANFRKFINKTITEILKTDSDGFGKTLNEEQVNFNAIGGRSPKGTIGYFIENYLLNLASSFVSKLDNDIKSMGRTLILLQNETKLDQNNVFFKFKIREEENPFSVTLTCNLDDSARTICAVNYKGIDNKYDLTSKYSKSDLDLFIEDSVKSITNLIKISN